MHYALLPVDPLFLAVQSKSKPSTPPVTLTADDTEVTKNKALRDSALYFWQSPTWRQRLSTTCALCHIPCELEDMDAHLTSYHTQWIDSASHLAALTGSPYLDCCQYCLRSSDVVDWCPVATNLAFLLASDGQLSHQPGRHDGSDGGRAGSHLRKSQHETEETTHPRRGDIRDLLRATSKAAQQDQFIIFLQASQKGVLGHLIQRTQKWKKEVETQNASSSLKHVLWQQLIQLLSERFGHLAQATSNSELWKEATASSMLTSAGAWPYLMWCPKDRRLKMTDRPPIPMVKMQSQIEELVEISTQQDQIIRFKSLKAMGENMEASQVCPWLIQVSMRHQRLWELLQLLSGSALWLLIQARLRPHQMRENPLASSLAKQELRRPLPQEEMTGLLLALRLHNSGNTCYQNATTLSMGWAILHLADGMWSDFGVGEDAYVDLCSQESLWVNLDSFKTFQPFLQDWRQGRQQDVHEFTQAFLHWMKPKSIGVSWHSRLEREGIVQISDSGAKWTPPTLSTSDPTCKHVHVQELIDSWQTYRGMSTSFQTDSRIIGVHVDRYALDHSGQPCKQVWHLDVLGTILLPIQPDNTLRVDLIEYQVIAGVVHIGGDRCGHMQAVGRTEAGWFLLDDDAEARLLPDDGVLRQHWTFLWLIKVDAHTKVLPRFPVLGHDQRVSTLAQHLKQLDWNPADHMDHLPRELEVYFRVHCAVCGKVIFNYETLTRHLRLKHTTLWQDIFTLPAYRLSKFCVSQLPCYRCGTKIVFWGPDGPTDLDHKCHVELNYRVALAYHEEHLAPRSTLFTADEQPLHEGLAAWLQ